MSQARRGKSKRDQHLIRVAVVTHVAVIRVLTLCNEGRDLNDYRKVPVPKNAGVFRLDRKPLSLRVRKD